METEELVSEAFSRSSRASNRSGGGGGGSGGWELALLARGEGERRAPHRCVARCPLFTPARPLLSARGTAQGRGGGGASGRRACEGRYCSPGLIFLTSPSTFPDKSSWFMTPKRYTLPVPSGDFPSGASGKESVCQCRRRKRLAGSIPRSGRSTGAGQGSPLQYSCLENPMDRGAWSSVGSVWDTTQVTWHAHTSLQDTLAPPTFH